MASDSLRTLLASRPWQTHAVGPRASTDRPFWRQVGLPAVAAVAFALGAGVVAGWATSDPTPPAGVQAVAPKVTPAQAQARFAQALAVLRAGRTAAVAPSTAALDAAGLPHVAAADTSKTLAIKLLAADRPFLALAVSLEDLRTVPYWDPGGMNLGMGYCVDKREAEKGALSVRADLEAIGLPEASIQDVLSNTRARQERVRLTPDQALALLARTAPEYEAVARQAIGGKTFDALPSHRRAALSWLAYNTGDTNFNKFRSLHAAVKSNAVIEALDHLTPHYRDGGVMVPNARAGTWLMAAFWSKDGLKAAIERPEHLLEQAQAGTSPVLIVDRAAARLKQALPDSPYAVVLTPEPEAVAPAVVPQVAAVPSPLEGAAPEPTLFDEGAEGASSPVDLATRREARAAQVQEAQEALDPSVRAPTPRSQPRPR